jgi:hypothetical protein
MAEGRQRLIGKASVRGGALAGAAALAAALYVTVGAGGNGADAAACAPAGVQAQALDPLIGGEVAAFQVAKAPEKLSDLAFSGAAGEPMTWPTSRAR